jgi:MHS family proline/betaine transporter-like MFS transporter
MPTYFNYFIGIPSDTAFLINTTAIFIALPLYGLGGYLSQVWGYHRLIIVSIFGIVISSLIAFKGLQGQIFWGNLLVFQLLLILFFAPMNGVFIEMLVGLFPKTTRSLGVSLAWSLPPAFIGSTAPLVCSYVIHKTGWLTFPAFYIMAFGLLALPIALKLKPISPTV